MKATLQLIAFLLGVTLFHPLTAKAETPLWIGQIENTLLAPVGEPIIAEAYRRIGKQVTFIPSPSKRSLMALKAGKNDGEMLRTERISQLYPELIKIDVPIFLNATYALTCHDDVSVSSFDDLSNYTIGIMKGLLSIEKRTQHLNPRPFVSYDVAFQLLTQKKIDIIVAPLFHASAAIHQARNKDSVKILQPALLSTPLYHYIGKKNHDLVKPLTKALREMKQDGTIKHIVTEEFRKNGISPPDDIF